MIQVSLGRHSSNHSMPANSIYRITERGRTELARRGGTESPFRRVLALVDGVASVAAIASTTELPVTEAEAQLLAMMLDGWVEEVPLAAAEQEPAKAAFLAEAEAQASRRKVDAEAKIRAELLRRSTHTTSDAPADMRERLLMATDGVVLTDTPAAVDATAANDAEADGERDFAGARFRQHRLEARLREEREARERLERELERKVTSERTALETRLLEERKALEEQLEAERRARESLEVSARSESERLKRAHDDTYRQLEAEREAREAAEMKARIESRARASVEEETRQKIEAEMKAQQAADIERRAQEEYERNRRLIIEAREHAERDAELKLRAEQDMRAKELASTLKVRAEEKAQEPVFVRPRFDADAILRFLRGVAILILLLAAVALAALHVVPLQPVSDRIATDLSARLGEQVTAGVSYFSLFPKPRVRVDGVTIGSSLGAKVREVRAYPDITELVNGKIVFPTVELDGVSMSAESAQRTFARLTSGAVAASTGAVPVGMTSLSAKRVEVASTPPIPPFDLQLSFGPNGAVRTFSGDTADGTWRFTGDMGKQPGAISITGRNTAMPFGLAFPVAEITGSGSVSGASVDLTKLEGVAAGGQMSGTFRADWTKDVKISGDIGMAGARADEVLTALSRDVSVKGKLNAKINVTGEAPTYAGIEPRYSGQFDVAQGSIGNVDLVGAMQAAQATAVGGITKFEDMTGSFSTSGDGISFRGVKVAGGVLAAQGAFLVGKNGALSGRVDTQLRSSVAQDRAGFEISGSVAKPVLKRIN